MTTHVGLVRRTRALALAIVLTSVAAGVTAAEPADRKAEIGLGLAGVVVTSVGGDSVFAVGAPASSAVHATLFVSPRLALEPQLAFTFASSDGDSVHALVLAGQVDYFLGDRNTKSPFLFGRGLLQRVGDSDVSYTSTGVGGGVGYRIPIGDRAVFRLEGRYDHLFESDSRSSADQFSAIFAIGVRL